MFDGLCRYCYRVASAARLMTSEIFGYRDRRAPGHAVDLGIVMLDGDSRPTVKLMSSNYRRILGMIERNGHDVYARRASVPLHRKLMTAPGLWYATR